MLVYAFVSWLRILLKVRAAVKAEDRVWVCDYVDTPFILGVIRPRIYLPSSLSEGDRTPVIAHEKAHLARRDHLWKPLGYLLLAAFWFNPLLWLAYILLCRDIEYACDEKVLVQLGESEKKHYAEALLNVSIPRRMIIASPLAFGETGIKGRIRNVLKYKKATVWIIAAAVILLAVTAVCFLTNPRTKRIEINKDDVARVEYREHQYGTFRAYRADKTEEVDALIDALNGDYSYVKKDWDFKHNDVSGYGKDKLTFYKADGTVLEEVEILYGGGIEYVMESAFLGDRMYRNEKGYLKEETIQACFEDGPWHAEADPESLVYGSLYQYCWDLYKLAEAGNYVTIEPANYDHIQSYIVAKVIKARGLAAEQNDPLGIKSVDISDLQIHSIQPEDGDPQTVEADITCRVEHENGGRVEKWQDRLAFELEKNEKSYRVKNVRPVLGDDLLLVEEALREKDSSAFDREPVQSDYEAVDRLVEELLVKFDNTPVAIRDVLTGEIRYFAVTLTEGKTEDGYNVFGGNSLYDADMNLLEESETCVYGSCLGSKIIKSDMTVLLRSSSTYEELFAGTCLYDPATGETKLQGLYLMEKLNESRVVAIDATGHVMGLLDAQANMAVSYTGEMPLAFAGVEDGILICTDDNMENEVRLDENLQPVGDQEDGSLPAEAQEVLQAYVTDILSAMAADSTRTFSAEEFATIDGYIAAKNMELRRQYYNRTFSGGVTDLKIGVMMKETPEAEDGLTKVRVICSQSYTCGGVYRTVDENNYTVSMLKKDDGTWSCVDIASEDRYDRLLGTGLPGLHDNWIKPDQSIESTPEYVDEVLTELYGRLGKGDVSEAEIRPMESDQWTKEELELAADAVKLHCIAHGTKLLELHLASDWEVSVHEGANALHPGKTIVFWGSWLENTVDEESVYEGWAWLVNPNNVGGWIVEGEGY